MARVTIVKEDGLVGVDGEFRAVDLSDFPADVHAVQWDDTARRGEIEFNSAAKPNKALVGNLGQFQVYRERWKEAGEPVRITRQREAPKARRARLVRAARDLAEAKRREVLGDPGMLELVARLVNNEVTAHEREALALIGKAEKAVIKRINIDTYTTPEQVSESGLWDRAE